MEYFQNIDRNYKDDLPQNTLKRIHSILRKLDINVNYEVWNNLIHNVYSVRIEANTSNIFWGTNGKGRNKSYALASAYAEFIERLQNGLLLLELPLWSFFLKKIKKESGYHYFPDEKILNMEEFLTLPEELILDFLSIKSKDAIQNKTSEYFENLKYNKADGVVSVPFYNIQTRQTYYFPLRLVFNAAGSTGMAAGNTIEEAIYQGLCEIIERYAASYIYYNGITPPTIDKTYLMQFPYEYNIIQEIESKGYKVIVKDFSCNKKLPAVGTLIIDIKNNKYKLNIGTDTSFQIALSRTLTEILQGINTDSEFEGYLLDIPHREHDYFLRTDSDSVKKANNEFEKFTVNGMGVFPHALFKNVASYDFDNSIYGTRSNYKEEVKYLIDLFKTLNSQIYIRNVSFLGFPSVFIYASNNISYSSRKVDISNLSSIDYMAGANFISLEKSIFPFQDFINRTDLNDFFSTKVNFYSNNQYYDNPMAAFLGLKFEQQHYWSKIPVSYFISLQQFSKKNYKDALMYWEYFITYMGVENIDYYREVKEYISNLVEKKESDNISSEIISDMNMLNIFDNIAIPMCPNCKQCKLFKVCITKKNMSFSIKLIKEMEKTIISQENIAQIINN